jgi:hypothetical protein
MFAGRAAGGFSNPPLVDAPAADLGGKSSALGAAVGPGAGDSGLRLGRVSAGSGDPPPGTVVGPGTSVLPAGGT